MLKPVDPGPPPPERPIGELVHELVEDGKAYARAEFDLAKAIGTAKARALVVPAAMFAAALFIAMAGLNALAFGVVLALAKFLGPLLAGFVGLLIFAAIAGALVWWGIGKAKQAL
jgi:hypothetical protein